MTISRTPVLPHRRTRRRTAVLTVFCLLLCLLLCACSGASLFENEPSSVSSADSVSCSGKIAGPRKLSGDSDISRALTLSGESSLKYAEQFRLFEYDGGYRLLNTCDGSRYLIVPAGTPVPEDLDSDVTVLQQPMENIYLAASAVMDMFVSMGSIDAIALSGTDHDDWSIEEARAAMEDGRIVYAGKYSTPDYELILSRNCSLAIENTMILHTPDVREKLMETGIPVLVDYSSYETHPLGRAEWVKVYGALTGCEEAAAAAFEEQVSLLDSVTRDIQETTAVPDDDSDRITAVFFSITSNGTVTLRKSHDYVPKMMELAGGHYLFDDLTDGTASSSVHMQMEEFCSRAVDADVLLYNGTIDGDLSSIDDLLKKAPLLKKFRAITNDQVWLISSNLYQDSMQPGRIISDFHRMFRKIGSVEDDNAGDTGGINSKYTYLTRLH